MNYTEETNSLTFLGTGGARFMVSRQILASGGIWLNLDGKRFLIDPGPGSIVQVCRLGLNPENLSAILLSHRHLDHSGDVNVMIEAMTQGGFNKNGHFLAPKDALDNEPVIYSYLRPFLNNLTVLEEEHEYNLDGIKVFTTRRHQHPVETYGFIFESSNHRIGFVSDTRYFEEIPQIYAGCDVLIINVVLRESIERIYHLSIADAARLITGAKPKTAILTHFGLQLFRADPASMAAKVEAETGIPVIAAVDDLLFKLE
ncbi:MBL fold metallo-hydrolase [Dehalococcoides mccartyi]|uniref:Beta-lactamase domain protein n=1 Tax=Dehalococcoides mccartyi (strain VS) TaxID=311424 RepID=D2BJV6_DEHMV|nr:MBL fold metallo-hydrolase [Dehalococcoides mccartyi]ACZ62606.1 beta-lactamase domain protein [Dehalococcoides mccartyi VS]